jgi:hypothetical protein
MSALAVKPDARRSGGAPELQLWRRFVPALVLALVCIAIAAGRFRVGM